LLGGLRGPRWDVVAEPIVVVIIDAVAPAAPAASSARWTDDVVVVRLVVR
jgi:hypothetical protein